MLVDQEKIIKPWGYEIIWARSDKYIGKILVINEGHKLSRQYHKLKEETIIVQQGVLSLEIGANEYKKEIKLTEGQSFHIEPNVIHRFVAPSGQVKLYEVSTTELADVIRLEDDYNRG